MGYESDGHGSDPGEVVEEHRQTEVHDQPQPPEEHGDGAHSVNYAVDGDTQPPEEHGNGAHSTSFADSWDDLFTENLEWFQLSGGASKTFEVDHLDAPETLLISSTHWPETGNTDDYNVTKTATADNHIHEVTFDNPTSSTLDIAWKVVGRGPILVTEL